MVLAIFATELTMQSRPLVRYPDPTITFIRTGLGICIFIVCFNAFTVHFWGANWVLLAIIMGMRAGHDRGCLSAADNARGRARDRNGQSDLKPSSRGKTARPAKDPFWKAFRGRIGP